MNRSSWVLLGLLVISGFFLLTEHRAHVLGILPFLLLLACPLLHLFFGGYGRDGDGTASPGHTHPSKGEGQ
ncbi:MAG TPA: DUF2933 domain-containing protein [Bellilinea sp.]|nr:DUF2933 domain-containing protein [Bellilinea sp.]